MFLRPEESDLIVATNINVHFSDGITSEGAQSLWMKIRNT